MPIVKIVLAKDDLVGATGLTLTLFGFDGVVVNDGGTELTPLQPLQTSISPVFESDITEAIPNEPTIAVVQNAIGSRVFQGCLPAGSLLVGEDVTPTAAENAIATQQAIADPDDGIDVAALISAKVEAALNDETDGSLTIAGLAAAVRADIERGGGLLEGLEQSVGSVGSNVTTINDKLPANTATQIALIEEMRGTDGALTAGSTHTPADVAEAILTDPTVKVDAAKTNNARQYGTSTVTDTTNAATPVTRTFDEQP